jgi:acetone carboxylase gamma subunit
MGLHETTFICGTDTRNYIVRCSCGYAFSGTCRAVEERASTHRTAFMFEERRWNDPRRTTYMPGTERKEQR